MVLDDGVIVEFDKPDVLFEKKDGTFTQLYTVSSVN